MSGDKFSDRVRFNWAFWDGRADALRDGRDRRDIRKGELFGIPSDAAYAAGYARGFDWAGPEPKTSNDAWKAEQEAKAARRAERSRVPETRVRRF